MLVFAEHYFKNERSLTDGISESEHKSSAARQWEALGRKTVARITEPVRVDIDPCAVYLWRWFGELTYGNLITGMAPTVLTWEGLLAWCVVMRIDLEPWEAMCLMRLSVLRARIHSENAS